MKLRLYHYWRSSASWRVRWALALKGLACDFVAVDLLSDETEMERFLRLNPEGYVPVLELEQPGGPVHLSESVAILEWCEEIQPEPTLLPGSPLDRARIRRLAEIINSGTQPLQNLTATEKHSSDPEERKRWNQFWIRRGLTAYEVLARESAGKFSVGNAVTMADLFLIPQCYSAGRNEVSLEEFPTIQRIHAAALETAACQASQPDRFSPK